MYYDKRVRSSTSRTATAVKFNMYRLFQKRKKDKQQKRHRLLRKILISFLQLFSKQFCLYFFPSVLSMINLKLQKT